MDVERTMTREVVTCRPEDSLERAAHRMRQHDCGGLPVVDDAGGLVGMITDRDICMAALERGRALRGISVREAMSRDVVSLAPQQKLVFAAELMAQFQVRRLPVLDEDRQPVGVLSLCDLARRADSGEVRGPNDVGMDDVTSALAAISRPPSLAELPCPALPQRARGALHFPLRRRSLASSRRSTW